MKLLAIDPASKKLGLAFFEMGTLTQTKTLTSEASTPLTRRLDMAVQLVPFLITVDKIASEEPFLMGKNNNGMQRLLGILEYVTQGTVDFTHPMSIKKFTGHGSSDKLDVALACGRMVETDNEREIIADAISREAWDETDAVAIGLCYLSKHKLKQEEV